MALVSPDGVEPSPPRMCGVLYPLSYGDISRSAGEWREKAIKPATTVAPLLGSAFAFAPIMILYHTNLLSFNIKEYQKVSFYIILLKNAKIPEQPEPFGVFSCSAFHFGNALVVLHSVGYQIHNIIRWIAFPCFPIFQCPARNFQSLAKLRLRQTCGLPYLLNSLHCSPPPPAWRVIFLFSNALRHTL